ncbi:uncharacterized protein LOC119736136 [Patiria miniata]|uniref:Endonuclease/exonuclease/phosphatase domain-containing protein n=1 Tax=Patiria miniata TaxID=46514 RepID=A0A914ARR2_PATMI|nr:uncharacterized protein LOC119736136 [Patiria miniata]
MALKNTENNRHRYTFLEKCGSGNCETLDSETLDSKMFRKKYSNKSHGNHLSGIFISADDLINKHLKINNYLDCLKYDWNFIGFSETFLKKNSPHLHMCGYKFVGQNREGKKGGGVGLYVREGIHFELKKDLIIQGNWCNSIFIEIPCPTGRNIVVGVVYAPTISRKNKELYGQFVKSFDNILSTIKKDNKTISYIMGDFNINLCSNHPFKEAVNNNDHSFLINSPTRVSTEKGIERRTLIDNIITNAKYQTTAGILKSDVSDHNPIYFFSPVAHLTPHNKQPRLFRRIRDQDINKLKDELQKTDWSHVYSLNKPNEKCNKLFSMFYTSHNECFPLTEDTWITDKILDKTEEKEKLFQKNEGLYQAKERHIKEKVRRFTEIEELFKEKERHFKENEKLIEEKERLFKEIEMYSKYNKICKELEQLIETAKKKYNNSKFHNYDIDIPYEAHRLKQHNYKSSRVCSCISKEANQHEMANLVHTYRLPGKPFNQKHLEKQHLLTPIVCATMHFTDITSEEIEKTADEIFKDNSPLDSDRISPYVVKKVIKSISKPLSHILNQSLNQGVFPDAMKIMKRTVFFTKKECKEKWTLSCFGEIFERIVHKQTKQFLEEVRFINNDKHPDEFEKFGELERSFTAIDKGILLDKLKEIGIRGTTHDWFSSYLEHRYQYTKYKSSLSDCKEVSTGIPCSSIGFLLYDIYTQPKN